ncbi:MAG TPA: TlpA disulfide reductase family protein [Candidatus Eremiobacteraceae bacterium]|nr:TlpA disulfide reductase family protein [Candidatus Eremiobacteraceae bacterium]
MIGWIVVAVLFTIAGLLFWRSISIVTSVPASATSSGLAHVGKLAPSIPLVTLSGTPIALRAYSGKPLWVNFFATWCPPCKDELPQIERRYERLHSSGLLVLGIDQQEEAKVVKPFTARFGLRYPILIDNGKGPNVYFLQALPTSVFIDRQGIVRFIQIGEMTPPMMDKALATILQ